MGIAAYIKDIGRGREGARALTREQARDLMAQVLDRQVSDLEVGAFCIAMRVKGETPDEMAGFLEAAEARLAPCTVPTGSRLPTVVLPSYNGARRLPVLTPLLALLLVRRGLRVLLHGPCQDPARVSSFDVLRALTGDGAPGPDIAAADGTLPPLRLHRQGPSGGTGRTDPLPLGDVPMLHAIETARLSPALQWLLDVRRTIGLRNPAHSLVKMMRPCSGPVLLVTSYTHPEYQHTMAQTLMSLQRDALLLRGTEGEAVADARRTPTMEWLHAGRIETVQAAQAGPLTALPQWPDRADAASTAAYTRDVLAAEQPVPEPLALQVEHIVRACQALGFDTANGIPSAGPGRPAREASA